MLFNILDLEQYQSDIIRSLRRVNSDYLQVGFYDSSFNPSIAQAMVQYQTVGAEESIALVYGTLIRLIIDQHQWKRKYVFVYLDQALALQGFISLRAYRLSPVALDHLKNEDDFSPEKLFMISSVVAD